jgi:phospholipid transport system transporter-binding protein
MTIQTNSSGGLSVSGALTFDSVASLYSQTIVSTHSGDIDLVGVNAVDSAGLALLLEWQAAARARGDNLNFVNAPSDLKRLAAMSEATDLLNLRTDHGDQ